MSAQSRPQPIRQLEYARENLVVDAESPSGLTWRTRRRGCARPDLVAGSMRDNGYWIVNVMRQPIRAHRLVWALTHGVDPHPWLVDHIDLDPGNNSARNLRLVSAGSNQRNGSSSVGSSRFKGVGWHGIGRKWRAYILVDGKQVHLGMFKSEALAAAAYNSAALVHFGPYARVNDLDNPGATRSLGGAA